MDDICVDDMEATQQKFASQRKVASQSTLGAKSLANFSLCVIELTDECENMSKYAEKEKNADQKRNASAKA